MKRGMNMLSRGVVLFILLILSSVTLAERLDEVVAVVNENVITASELDEQVDVLRKQIMAKKMQLPPEKILKKQVLQHLIDVDLQLQLADKNHIKIDDVELNRAVEKIAKNNQLNLAQLREELVKQGLSWPAYRKNIRKEILISRVQQTAVGNDVIISTQQVDDFIKTQHHSQKHNQTYHVKNIVIPLPEEPTTEQVKRAEKKAKEVLVKINNGADFSGLAIAESSGEYALEGGDLGKRRLADLPEIFSEQVIGMKSGEVAGPIRTGNGFHLIKLVSKGGNQQPHKVLKTRARHILLKPDSNMTDKEASRQAHNIYQQLKSGKNFARMAKQYSLDSASAVNGGDLGWVSEEELVPEFAKAMTKLPLNTVSKPVKSPFGWHLIEVLERKTVDDTEAYERQKVRKSLHQRKFTEAVQSWLQHLRGDAYVKVMDKALA